MNDRQLTDILRASLTRNMVTGIESYEWYKGEALYLGDPIWERATDRERNAIGQVISFIRSA